MLLDMKRYAIAGAMVLLTMGLAIFAIAVAQRDSRERASMLDSVEPDYANQISEPLPFALGPEPTLAVPINHLRTISEEKPAFKAPLDNESAEVVTSLDEPPAFPANDPPYLASVSIGESDVVQAAGQQSINEPTSANRTSSTPRLLAPPMQGSAMPAAPTMAPPKPLAPLPNLAPTPTNRNPPTTDYAPTFPDLTTLPGNAGTNLKAPAPPSNQGFPAQPFTGSVGQSAANATNSTSVTSVLPDYNRSAAPMTPNSMTPISPPSFPTPSPSFPAATNAPSKLLAPHAAPPNTENNMLPRTEPTLAPPRDLPRSAPLTSSSNDYSQNSARTKPQLASLVSSAPGSRQIDGAQNPSLQIQKRAPEEVQVGQPASFGLIVRNVGNATAYDVAVVDSVPRGTKLSKTNPPAEHRSDGTLIWSLGEMSAGSEQVLTVELIPETEGEIGSVASVNFAAQASVRTVSTQPKLVVKQVVDRSVLLGKPVQIRVTVINEGTGVARGVALEEDVPRGLRHPMGATLGVPMGDLAPGQSKSTDLELVAVEPGSTKNIMRAVASNTTTGESEADIEIVSPKLRLDTSGPKLRYLERQATYQISVTNEGTSTAFDVEIMAQLPRGMQYNSSGNHGEYLSDQHAISWSLEELPVGSTATTEMTLLPVEEGDFAVRLQGRAVGIESAPVEKQVRIEGQSELAFTIEDDNDPIETDGQTTYLVRLTNTGTRVDEDVQVMIELPPGAKALQVNAPVAYKETAQGLVFDPIPQMRAKDQQLYRFAVRLEREGVQIVRAHVKSKLRSTPVVKEESTQVYRDQ
jgi:uncharacterized repeat protein (TIGR01451 family)